MPIKIGDFEQYRQLSLEHIILFQTPNESNILYFTNISILYMFVK